MKTDCEEGWAPKNWCFWTVVLEKTLESPLVPCKKIKPVNPKGNQPRIFIGTTDAEAPVVWPRDTKSRLIKKDPDAGKDWRQEGKGMTNNKMVGWHHQLTGHEFEQALGNDEGQGSLVCCFMRSQRVKHNQVTEKQQSGRNLAWSKWVHLATRWRELDEVNTEKREAKKWSDVGS